MKGQTTNEVRAKIPGGDHCDQDLLDALDEIDAMRAAQTTCYEFAREHYPVRSRLLSLIHAICDAGVEK